MSSKCLNNKQTDLIHFGSREILIVVIFLEKSTLGASGRRGPIANRRRSAQGLSDRTSRNTSKLQEVRKILRHRSISLGGERRVFGVHQADLYQHGSVDGPNGLPSRKCLGKNVHRFVYSHLHFEPKLYEVVR